MKKGFYLIGMIGAFVGGCFLNKKYNWGIGDKIADTVQSAADYVAEKLDKTRGKNTDTAAGEQTGETSAS